MVGVRGKLSVAEWIGGDEVWWRGTGAAEGTICKIVARRCSSSIDCDGRCGCVMGTRLAALD